MSSGIDRRAFLGGAGAAITLVVIQPSRPGARSRDAHAASGVDSRGAGDRVAALIALSCDAEGQAHVAQAAFLSAGAAAGTLPVTSEELTELRSAMAGRDFVKLQECGLKLGGRKFVFLRETEDGAVVHAVRHGEFVTVRATGDELIVASSTRGMLHHRAVEAVYQYALRSPVIA